MGLYLDTSCLLKLLFPEPEAQFVSRTVTAEDHVVVSDLARLEALGQIHARVAGGHLARRAGAALIARLDELLSGEPFDLQRAPTESLEIAEDVVRGLPSNAYCPTLDRMHLSVMAALDLKRLLTNDRAQARAARALGYSVTLPR